jgi:hypothetical protein
MDNKRIRAILGPGLGGIALAAGTWCAFMAWKGGPVSLGLWGVVLL